MKCLVISLSLLLSAPAVFAEEILREISWTKLREAKLGEEGRVGGEVLPLKGAAPFEQLKVENAQGQPRTETVLTLEGPRISSARYAIRGQVRYDGVEGEGYLEMWNHFPDGSRYFSRTLGAAGPMKSLKGSSDWRPFVLPFYNKEGGPAPAKLVLNVVLPGRGTVYLGPLRLVQFGPGEDPLGTVGQWWSEQQAGLIGGALGTILGCMGALIGWLASAGKARRLALGMMKTMAVLGVAALVLGVVALLRSQPYAVYYPLLLIGLIGSVLPATLLRTIRKRYEEMELRRMRAMDVSPHR